MEEGGNEIDEYARQFGIAISVWPIVVAGLLVSAFGRVAGLVLTAGVIGCWIYARGDDAGTHFFTWLGYGIITGIWKVADLALENRRSSRGLG
jgi:hypothetical protein